MPGRIAPGSEPMTDRLAAYSAGQPPRTANRAAMPDRVSPAATVYRAGAPGPGSTSTVPGWIVPGSGPMTGRLAAYSAGQPPRTANRKAMLDRVSPSWTTYRVRGVGAVTGAAARSVLVKVILVLLCVRVFAWAGRGADPCVTAATSMIGTMLQASTTHADLSHMRIVLSLSFQGDQRRALRARTPTGRTG